MDQTESLSVPAFEVVQISSEDGISLRHRQEGHKYDCRIAFDKAGRRVLSPPSFFELNAEHGTEFFANDAYAFAVAEARKAGIIN